MLKSIKYFLIISLLLSITLASAINGLGNYILDEKVVQPYLDSQLIRMSSLIEILNQSTKASSQIRSDLINYLRNTQPITGQKFFFEVWRNDGTLLMKSSDNMPPLRNSTPGFSDKVIKREDWRVYRTKDSHLNANIIVAEQYNLRRQLADDIARSNAHILLIIYPLFGILIWFIISLALRSIARVTSEISHRASTFLEPVQLTEIPSEIKPLVAELNQLFVRLKHAFERNKRFAADAAHELRTPLAALKTHVQVALKTDNENDRQTALKKVIESVDRSSHVVAQLLTLSKLGEEETLTDVKPVNLHKLAIEIIAYLAPNALEKNIELELMPNPRHPFVKGNDTALGILIRNLVDNAIRYTPPNGAVTVSILDMGNQVVLRVTDTGMGIPPELRERVFERFFRVLGTQASGSGLGLAIVSQIAALHYAEIRLETPPNGIGLQFDVAFPKLPA